MVEKDVLIVEKMATSGIFDFSGFYSYAHSWFINENYAVYELRYSEKVSGNSRDIIIEWVAIKRYSDYFKFEIGLEFKIKDLNDVEVEIDGKKKKSNKGNIDIEIKGVLVKDPDSRWDLSPFSRFMRDVYNKYIVPSRIDQVKDLLIADAKKFKEETKAYFDLVGKTKF